MMSLLYVFWMYVILFAVIGALRGWAKELLVTFAVVVSLTLNFMLHRFMPVVKELPEEHISLFWIRIAVLGVIVYFGYQTVISVARLQSGARRERLQDSLFGVVLGGFNGYLIAGTVWYYLDRAGYPFPNVVSPPTGDFATRLVSIMNYMPPHVLGEPAIYFASTLVLIFILVVYV
jgi:hypothetical protein